ncbi:MAG: pyridoxal-phosphate-dependent aminotransferase family protein [Candidatus Aminicenantales bacterium]
MDPLLLIPGPSPVVSVILEALARPTVSHVSAALAADFRVALADLKKIIFTSTGEPFLFAGSGTLAMEVALLNTAGKNHRVLILSQGFFGDRMGQIGEAFGLDCDILRSRWGSAVRPEDLRTALEKRRYDVVAVTHVDTGTGAAAPIRAYADVLKGRDLIWIVDGVCATGGIEERMDEWGIDVVLTAAQKCFGAPPGLAIDVFSKRAIARRQSLTAIPAYYTDILRWRPGMDDPQKYFSTHAVNEIRAFASATRIVMEEGLPERFLRHERIARAIRAGLETLGFGLFTEPEFQASTLSVIRYPDGVDDAVFRAKYLEAGFAVAGGLGETAGRVFRMGHMGNLTSAQAAEAIGAMGAVLNSMGRNVDAAGAVEATARALKE